MNDFVQKSGAAQREEFVNYDPMKKPKETDLERDMRIGLAARGANAKKTKEVISAMARRHENDLANAAKEGKRLRRDIAKRLKIFRAANPNVSSAAAAEIVSFNIESKKAAKAFIRSGKWIMAMDEIASWAGLRRRKFLHVCESCEGSGKAEYFQWK